MKALRTTLAAVVLFIGAMTVNAQVMSIATMRSNARFLTDRMAYTLGINDPYLIDEMYRINYDYIWGVNDYLDDVAMGYYYDDYMAVVAARDAALRNLLGYNIWNILTRYSYFYRPIVFVNHGWRFSIYDYDRYGVHRFYFNAPRPYGAGYAGGHFFRPMPPRSNRMAPPPPAARHAPAPRHTPAPGGSYRGAMPRGNQAQPQGGHTPQPQMNQRGQMQPQGGSTHQPQMNQRGQMQPQGGSTHQPQMNQRGQMQPQGGSTHQPQGGSTHQPQSGSTPRSSSNMHSSSRGGNTMTTRSAATPVRVSNGATRGSSAMPGNSAPRGAGGPIRGGRR